MFTKALVGESHKGIHQIKDFPAKYLKEGHRIIGHPLYNYLLNMRKGDPMALMKLMVDPHFQRLVNLSEEEQAADVGHDLLDLLCKDPAMYILVEMWAAQGGT